MPARLPSEIRTIADFKVDFSTDALAGHCWLSDSQPADAFAKRCTEPAGPGRASWAIWGDSHAARLTPGLRHVLHEGVALSQFNRDGCVPLQGLGSKRCQESNTHVLDRLRELRPEVVILFAHWGARVADWGSDKPHAQQLLVSVRQLRAQGAARVLVMGPAPHWNEALPKLVYQAWREGLPRQVPLRMATGLRSEVGAIDVQLAELLRGEKIEYISVRDLLCESGACLTHVPGKPAELLSWDYGHLTTPGAILLVEALQTRGLLPR